MKYEIIFTHFFKRKIKKLNKKYKNIKSDLAPLFINLEKGKLIGDPIPELFNQVFKVRIPSSDMKRGKSGGFRVIYYFKQNNNKIYMLTIYSKSKQENISLKDIHLVLNELEGMNVTGF